MRAHKWVLRSVDIVLILALFLAPLQPLARNVTAAGAVLPAAPSSAAPSGLRPEGVSLPDLIPQSLSAPPTAAANETITVNWSVHNPGSETLQTYWYDGVFLSRDNTWDYSDLAIGWGYTFNGLAGGATYTQSLGCSLPGELAGDYYLILVIDYGNGIDEASGSNNNLVTPLRLQNVALQASSLTAPASAAAGQAVDLSWTVRNNGAAQAPLLWQDALYLSRDAAWDSQDTPLGAFTAPAALASGASYTQSLSLALPGVPDGDYYLIVRANSGGELFETNRSDNLVTRAIHISAADLLPQTFSVPASGVAGQPVSLSWTVKNQGAGLAQSPWNDQVYLSRDNLLDSLDTLIGVWQRGETVAAGATYSAEGIANLPATPAGAYYLILRPNANSSLFESDYANNNRAAAITITTPDLQPVELTAPAQAPMTGQVQVSWRVQNKGSGKVAPIWIDGLYLSRDAAWDLADSFLVSFANYAELAPGGEYAHTEWVGIPGMPAGEYYLILKTDYSGSVYEANAQNDTLARAITLIAPDLAADSISTSSPRVVGEAITIAWTVRNAGTTEVRGDWFDLLFLSRDSTLDNQDTGLYNLSHSGPLAAGATYTQNVDLTLPRVAAGSYYLLLVTDGYTHLPDGNWANNVTSLALPLTSPDLHPTSLAAPTGAAAGSGVTVSWEVENLGSGPALPNWGDNIYFSTDATWDDQDTYLKGLPIENALAAGARYSRNLDVTLPQATPGSYYLILKVDDGNEVHESDPKNNIRAAAIQITASGAAAPAVIFTTPDLLAVDLTAPAVAAPNHTLDLAWTVQNGGAGPTGQTSWSDQLYLSSDAAYDDQDVQLASAGNPGSLGPGESYTQNGAYNLPPTADGDYSIILRVDGTNQVWEGNPANNFRSRAISVRAPDLAPLELNGPASAANQETVTFSWRVQNQGAGLAQPTWNDRLYLSTDNHWDSTDAELACAWDCWKMNQEVQPGAVYTRTVSAALPNLPAGSYYLILAADSDNHLWETDPLDNYLARPLQLTSPDLTPESLTLLNPAVAGFQVGVEWRLRNQGAGLASPCWGDRFFLSTDAVWDEQDLYLGEYAATQALAAGATQTNSMAPSLPRVPAGDYYLILSANHTRWLGEAQTNNNFRSLAIRVEAADLAPQQLSVPASAAANRPVQVVWTVSNQGGAAVSGNWDDLLYFSRDAFLDDRDINIGSSYHWGTQPLAPGASYTVTTTVTLPAWPAGDYYLLLLANNGSLPEGNTQNNLRSAAVKLTTADLVAQTLSAASSAASQARLVVSWKVKNQGGGPAVPEWGDMLVLSRDNTWDPQDITLSTPTWNGGLLPVGSTYTQTVTVTLPAVTSGDYYLVVAANRQGEVGESAYANNRLARALHIENPDLAVTGFSGPQAAAAGQQIQVSWQVNNPSTAPVPGGWYDRVYLSEDALWDLEDIPLAWDAHQDADLAPGAAFTWFQNLALPLAAPGDYHLILQVDNSSQRLERDEQNNSRSLPLRLEPAPQSVNTPWKLITAEVPTTLTGLDFSPEGARLAGAANYTANLWDVQTGSLRGKLTGHAFGLKTVEFSPGGSQVLTGADDGAARIYDAATLSQVRSFPAVYNAPNPATYSADGRKVLAGYGQGQPHLWDAQTGELLRTFVGHSDQVTAVALSPDGSQALTGAYDGRAILWDTSSGAARHTLFGHTGPVNSVAFAPGGGRALTAGSDGLLYLWDVDSGRPVATLVQGNGVNAAAFSADGAYIVSCGGWPGVVYLWEAARGVLLRTFIQDDQLRQVQGVAISPDRTLIAASYNDYVLRLWPSGLEPATAAPVTPLAIGSGVDLEVSSTTAQYFELSPQAGRSLLVSLAASGGLQAGEQPTAGAPTAPATSGSLRLYLRAGALPSVTTYDASTEAVPSGLEAEISLSPTLGVKYYLLVLGANLEGPALAARLRAEYVGFHLSSVTPAGGGNAGSLTVRLAGAGFTEAASASLTGPGSIPGSLARFEGPGELWITFDLRGAAPGAYDLRLEQPGETPAVLPGGFQVSPGSGPQLAASLDAPQAIRPERIGAVWLEWSNVGDADLDAPLFLVTSVPTVPLSLDPEDSYVEHGLFVLGANPSGPAGVLPPGAANRVPVYFKASTTRPDIRFKLEAVAADSTPVDWNAIEAQARPAGMEDGLWETIWQNFTWGTGLTWADFTRTLRGRASFLSVSGRPPHSGDLLIDVVVIEANSGHLRTTLSWAMDASVDAPGLPLALTRSYLDSLESRNALGAFGRGWSHSLEYRLSQPDANTVAIDGPGALGRSFTKRSDGAWQSGPGDWGLLETAPDGFRLTEKDGLAWRFAANGRLVAVEDSLNNRLSLSYDSNGRLNRVSHTNGLSLSLEYTAQGRIARLVDHAGRATSYGYDSSGEHLLSVSAPGGLVTRYTYYPAVGSPYDHALQSVELAAGTHEYFAYDAQGRLSATWRDGNAERVEYSYDDRGGVYLKDAAGGVTRLRLGERGQLLASRDPLGNELRVEYDSGFNPRRVVQPSGGWAETSYDARGNPLVATNALGYRVQMGYTGQDDLDWLRDPNGNLTDLSYDPAGNLAGILHADGSQELFTYTANGSPQQITNRRGQAAGYTYDSLGRLTRKDYPGGGWVTYAYDTVGRVTTVTDPSGAIGFEYDSRDFVTRVSYPGGRWFSYTYNLSGQLTRRTSDDGAELNYVWDAAGRLQAVKNGSSLLVQYDYDSAGRLAKETRGNGTTVTYTLDAAGRLTGVTHRAANNTVQASYTYTYDANGNRLSATSPAGRTDYTYDPAGQLTGVKYPNGETLTYTYDPAGNRLAVTSAGSTANYTPNNLNQYTQAGALALGYDLDGNLTGRSGPDGASTYTYDSQNRLLSASGPGGESWVYGYNALGCRTSVRHNGVETRYLCDPVGPFDIAAEYSTSGVLQARYVGGLGLAARIDSSGQAAYYGFDAAGNTRLVTNASGAIANQYDYDPFGRPRGVFSETIPNPFRFVGRGGVMADGEIYFMRARYYDPALGRFLSPDPIGLAGQDANLYRYAGNNPVMANDPQGTFATLGLGALGGAIGGVVNTGLYAITSLASGSINGRGLLGAFAAGAIAGGVAGLTGGASLFGMSAWGTGAAVGAVGAGVDYGITRAGTSRFSPGGLAVAMLKGGVWGAYGSFLSKRLGEALPPSKWGKSNLSLRRTLMGENQHGKQLRLNTLGDTITTGLQNSVDKLLGWADDDTTQVVRPADPNDKLGPPGLGAQHAVTADEELAYTVRFENQAAATAPVQELVVVDYLDPDLDWSTFRFVDITYGDRTVPAGGATGFSLRDYPGSSTVVTGETEGEMAIDISAALDPVTGRVEWRMRAIDTATGLPPEDPLAGFLPPEDGTGRGQGQVTFSVRPAPGLALGTQITNLANIVFDTNPAIATNTTSNVIAEIPRLHFSAVAYQADEGQGQAQLYVARSGGSAGAVTVHYTLQGRSATASSDFTPLSGTLSFADGDATPQTIAIPLVDDSLGEGDETLEVTLSAPGGGAVLGSPSLAVLTIRDNDTPQYADLQLALAAPAGPLDVGATLVYTFTVTNLGPLAAGQVTLSDNLPPGLTLLASSPSQGTCTAGRPLVCNLGPLANGAQATVRVEARATEPGVLTNPACVSSDRADPAPGNNCATAATLVLGEVSERYVYLPVVRKK